MLSVFLRKGVYKVQLAHVPLKPAEAENNVVIPFKVMFIISSSNHLTCVLCSVNLVTLLSIILILK